MMHLFICLLDICISFWSLQLLFHCILVILHLKLVCITVLSLTTWTVTVERRNFQIKQKEPHVQTPQQNTIAHPLVLI